MTWTRRMRVKKRLAQERLMGTGCIEGCHVEHAPKDDSGDIYFIMHTEGCPNLARIKRVGLEKAEEFGWIPGPDVA